MLRDGKPFNQSDEGASSAQSIFPPFPPSVVGAIRLALAEQNGFDGRAASWPSARLGDGTNWQASPSQLGPVRFSAPRLVLNHKTHGRVPLFPCPLHLVRGSRPPSEEPVFALLIPRGPFETDLGTVNLPMAEPDLVGVKACEGDFLTLSGMEKVLNGSAPVQSSRTELTTAWDPIDLPADIISMSALWSVESRVGIGLNVETRAANKGQIYSASHIRPRDELGIEVETLFEGDIFEFQRCLQRFGGEHRFASIEALKPDQATVLPAPPESLVNSDGGYVYAAIAISPVVFDELPGPGEWVPGLEGNLLSACFGKTQTVGGWSSAKPNVGPMPLRQVLPAGSVFFMRCADEEKAISRHGGSIGIAGEWGFGQILIARWNA